MHYASYFDRLSFFVGLPRSGYLKNSCDDIELNKNVSLVTDINECYENISGCAQNCKNAIGGFTCSCNTGYILGKDSLSCNGKLTR